ncbi:MAG: DNRLRE domain-containing protein, partial [bacterium]|nr:DNRLRE domain-containing protein [bacterium]
SDPEDGDVTASLSWTSSLDGAIGSGGSFSTSGLSAGTHVITASVTDAGGLQGSDAITITVNSGPSVSITVFVDGSATTESLSLCLPGAVPVPEDGDVTASLSWTSSLDGAIGSGGSFSTSGLSAGAHVITASVTDSGGLQDSDAITITVNSGPSVSITAPADGSGSNVGASVSFAGTASDPEDGDLTAGLTWTSDLDGVIGSGGSFSTSALSLGTHTITASVTDSGGLSAVDVITVTVTLPPVQIVLTSIGGEDGWVRESNENSNVGGRKNSTGSGSSALRPGDHKKDRQYKAVVSFDTSQIPAGATVLSATLRLQRGNLKGTNPFTTHGTCWVDVNSGGFSGNLALENGDFQAAAAAVQSATLSNAASNGDWSEGSLDAAGLSAIDTSGTTQMRVYFDLDDNDDGGDDYVGYYSGDNGTSSRHPQLVVVYQP